MQKTILIVDDISTNIKLLKELLQNEGYNIKVANSGQRALDIVAKKPMADLILLDIMMPKMDGYQVCQALKNDALTSSIPVIFITAKNKIQDEEKGFEIGAVDYISKPVSKPILLARVKTHLNLKSLMDNLSQKVEEETALRLHQEKILIQQSKQAAMGEMIDAVAHQWMQPLNIMSMDVEMLAFDYEYEKNTINSKYIKNFTSDFNSQITHLKETMDKFRTFLRPINHDDFFHVDEAIRTTLVLLHDELIKYNIQINTSLEEGIIFKGNATEFKHILINLINNSKDAFIEKDIQNRTIDLILKKEEQVTLEVIDNAGGIPSSIIHDIFNANITTKAVGKGTGIGLYLSKQIANKLHITLTVENTDDGAKFTLVKN